MKTLKEVNQYLIEASIKQQQRCREVRKKYATELGINQVRYCSEIMGGGAFKECSLEDNLENIMAFANNNMVAGLWNEYKVIDLENKFDKEKKLKQAAFLFILKSGMMDTFQRFLNEYKGDIKQELYSEMAKAI